MLLDIDHFKFVNDSLGYEAGDELLRHVASALRAQLPEGCTIGRFGEDEFGILLPHTDAEQAQAVARQIMRNVGHDVAMVGGQGVSVSFSVGIALFPETGIATKALMARADLAMYQAKENGRNRVVVYTPELGLEVQMESKLTWERHIRAALQHDRLVLHWQPILHLGSSEVSQYEVLVRMVGEGGEIIPPGAFLPVAERYGLIHDIDRWVVCKAIHLIAEFQQAGRTLCLEVNLSGRCFADSELLPMIRQELAATGIDPTMLVLEITETHAIADLPQARSFVDTLVGLGCRFAIDDFGSGFASFDHLKHLPVDYLKIDGSFIRNLPESTVDQHLVKAIVEVARGLGKQTVAEFVGNDATLVLLKSLGVDYAQGFHIGWPEPITAVRFHAGTQ